MLNMPGVAYLPVYQKAVLVTVFSFAGIQVSIYLSVNKPSCALQFGRMNLRRDFTTDRIIIENEILIIQNIIVI